MSGKVYLEGGRWCIQCTPDIRARLKRVFPRAPQHASDVIRISNTAENCRDLEWFLMRYPMNVLHMPLLRKQAQQHIETEAELQDFMAGRRPAQLIKLALEPRGYQIEVPQLLQIKKGLLLVDDLGLGKTVSAICGMANTENLPALVVCPAHLTIQWEKEIKRFLPELLVHRIRKGKPYPLMKKASNYQKDLWENRLPDVIILSYHMLRTWAEILAQFIRYIVFEECQQLRSPGTQIYMACKHVADKAELRLGLSATPIYNYGSEFFYVIDALLPGALGSRDEFVREWCRPAVGGKSRLEDAEGFGTYLRREGIMMRRTRRDVGRELPDLSRVAHAIGCDLAVINSAITDAAKLARIILAHNEKFRGEKMEASGKLDSIIRQATGIAKAPYVAEFVRMILESSGERIVLFGWHREVYRIWMEKLKEFNPVLYTGSETPVQKNTAIRRFTEGTGRVLIMSLRSGSGVDGLQDHAKVAVFGELDWSPGVHEQCMGRLHRDGQKDKVIAYYMISDEGADPIMAEVLGVKREQIENVRNPGSNLAEPIETGRDGIRALAIDVLKRRGEAVEEEPAAA